MVSVYHVICNSCSFSDPACVGQPQGRLHPRPAPQVVGPPPQDAIPQAGGRAQQGGAGEQQRLQERQNGTRIARANGNTFSRISSLLGPGLILD